jgi:hypothetical protein
MAAQGQGGQAGADAGQQGDAQQGEQQGGPDYGALLSQLESVPGSLAETQQMVRDLAAQMQQAPGDDTGGDDTAPIDVDLSFLDADAPTFDPEAAQQQLSDVIGQLVDKGVQQHVAPLQQQQDEQRRQWETQQLVNEFPELNDVDTAREVLQSAQDYATALVPAIGQEAAQRLAQEPGFLRIMYAAGRSFEQAAQEGSDDSSAAHLEGGGGANPGAGQQVDLGDLIVNGGSDGARLGSRVLPFQ